MQTSSIFFELFIRDLLTSEVGIFFVVLKTILAVQQWLIGRMSGTVHRFQKTAFLFRIIALVPYDLWIDIGYFFDIPKLFVGVTNQVISILVDNAYRIVQNVP